MQQTAVMGGFSDLKDFLISKYQIGLPKQELRLHFRQTDEMLLMHNYHEHEQHLILVINLSRPPGVPYSNFNRGNDLIRYACENSKRPAELLNYLFLLNGSFKF